MLCDPSAPVSTFGAAIATYVRGTVVPVPAAFLIEALLAIGADLASTAAEMNPRAETAFASVIDRRIGGLLGGSGHSITGPIRVGSSREIHSLIVYRDRQMLALDVCAGLTPATIQARLDQGADVLRRVQPGGELRTPTRTLRLPDDAEIVRAQVIAGPHLGAMFRPSHPVIPLEDLEWILRSLQGSHDDLWYFVRDLAHPAGVQASFAWDLIDRWEVWRQQKSFYRGGTPLTFMMFTPHESVAEWTAGAAASPLERALYILGLPPVRDWPVVDLDDRGNAEIADLNTNQFHRVLPYAVPIVIASTDSAGPLEYAETLWDLAAAFAWKLSHMVDAFTAAARSSDLSGLQIVFAFQEAAEGTPLALESLSGTRLTIRWNSQLQAALAEDSFAVERLAGEVISQAMEASVRDALATAWEATPPGIRVDGYLVRQHARKLPDPLSPHGAIRSDAQRRLGEHLAAAGMEPGVREGLEATQFESRTVFPWLVSTFHATIAGLSGRELLEFALHQIERVHHQRLMLDKELGWQLGFPTRGQRTGIDRREPVGRLARTMAFIVEEILARPPEGEGRVDELAWIGIVSVAELCIESSLRSDALHHQLTRTSTQLTGSYEVNVISSDDPTDIDMRAYSRLRAQHTLPAGVPIATGQAADPGDHSEPRTMLEQMPELGPIDSAMRGSIGFGVDALTGVLNVAIQWETDQAQSATQASPDQVVDECVEFAVGACRDEYAAAVDWLTLRGDDLAAETIPHWETERRAKRVATSPFIASADDLWILPWSAEHTLRILATYLGDGRLPWPAAHLPNSANQALARYRQQQNREAEKDCVAALQSADLVVRPGVKPNKAGTIGIPRLSGEIDALCVDPGRSRIWVIEVKDSYTPYSAYQVRRLVNTFNEEGKYVDKLLTKVRDISGCTTSLATALKLPDPGRNWVVSGLMATRHLEPAAFTVNQRVPFCIIADVLEVVTRDDLPGPGLNGSSATNQVQTVNQK